MARFVSFLALSVAGACLMAAQEFRATVLGVVTDPAGAVVPGASVTVTNLATGVASSTRVNSEGNYVAPFLIPGTYQVRVEHPGFKVYERSPLELRVNDRVRLDIQLEVGQISERVSVTAEAPLVETATGDRGQVIDRQRLAELPTQSRNPITLVTLSTGVSYTGSLLYFRPFDQGAIDGYSINGGRPQRNEVQLDGMSNANARGGVFSVTYIPPQEATQEFKVQTSTYDAQYGRTSGGIVSISVKSGTNRLHGAAYGYMKRTALSANQFVNNAQGRPRVRQTTDQWGFALDGPVVLPRLYSGKERTFFTAAYEKYVDSRPLWGSSSALATVPTPSQRQGDFSRTLNTAGRLMVIHDPLTIRPNPAFVPSRPVSLANLQYLRSPFAGNRVPEARMNAVALRVLKDIPPPNQPGDPVTGVNNWFSENVDETNSFPNYLARVDHKINDAWKIFGRWSHSRRSIHNPQGRYDWNTPAASNKFYPFRQSDSAVLDAVAVLSPSTILSVRGGFARFNDGAEFRDTFDQSSLGFPAAMVRQLQLPDRYPVIAWEDYTGTGNNEQGRKAPTETLSGQASLTKTTGRHSMRFGVEYRAMRLGSLAISNGAGNYRFTRSWSSSNPQVADPAAGNSIASFLLGYMASGFATLNVAPYHSWRYPVAFFQDDWQLSRRLTLNLGLRWDYETPPVERYDRMERGFDFAASSPVRVPGFDLKGGLLFAGAGGGPRGAFDPDRTAWQPRIGLAYRLFKSRPLVFRGGAGRYFLPVQDRGAAPGFSQTTDVITSTPGFLPLSTFSNPFPQGLIQPPGASQGLATQVGNDVSFNYVRRRLPYVWQYSAGFQYEAWRGFLLDFSYVGSRTAKLGVNRGLNVLSESQLALGTAYLSEAVPNPFYGIFSPRTVRGAQPAIQRRSLLLPYPHFAGVTMNNNSFGTSWYNSFQLRAEQRLRNGVSMLVSYTFSKTMEAAAFKNAVDRRLSRELASFHMPHRLAVSGIYSLPLEKGRPWASQGIAAHLLGGWQLSGNLFAQSGIPMGLPDYYINGDPRLRSGQTLQRWFDTSPSIWLQRPPDTLRTAPLRSPNIRRHSAPQLDAALRKEIRIAERHSVQFRVSSFNAANTPLFGSPNTTPTSRLFGVVPPNQINLPRNIEFGFRYAF